MIDISLKVLVVDDDPDILELLQYNLEGEVIRCSRLKTEKLQ
jgi:DNA-binding response OmpR family regulator